MKKERNPLSPIPLHLQKLEEKGMESEADAAAHCAFTLTLSFDSVLLFEPPPDPNRLILFKFNPAAENPLFFFSCFDFSAPVPEALNLEAFESIDSRPVATDDSDAVSALSGDDTFRGGDDIEPRA